MRAAGSASEFRSTVNDLSLHSLTCPTHQRAAASTAESAVKVPELEQVQLALLPNLLLKGRWIANALLAHPHRASGSTGDSPQHREARASAVPITGRRPALSFAAAVHPAHAPNSSPSTNAAVAPTAASVDGSTVNLQSAGSGNAQACRTFYSRSAFSGFPAFASLLALSVAWVAHATKLALGCSLVWDAVLETVPRSPRDQAPCHRRMPSSMSRWLASCYL